MKLLKITTLVVMTFALMSCQQFKKAGRTIGPMITLESKMPPKHFIAVEILGFNFGIPITAIIPKKEELVESEDLANLVVE